MSKSPFGVGVLKWKTTGDMTTWCHHAQTFSTGRAREHASGGRPRDSLEFMCLDGHTCKERLRRNKGGFSLRYVTSERSGQLWEQIHTLQLFSRYLSGPPKVKIIHDLT